MTAVFSRAVTAVTLSLLGFALVACGSLAAMGEPTHRYVLEVDSAELDKNTPENKIEPRPVSDDLIESTMDVLSKRIDATGERIHTVERTGPKQIVLEMRGAIDRESLEALLGVGPRLELLPADAEALPQDVDRGIAPAGSDILPMADGGGNVAVRSFGGIDGRYVTNAIAAPDQFTGGYLINISFDEKGGAKFARLTESNVGNAIAIVIDG